jgi:hypothetical protein
MSVDQHNPQPFGQMPVAPAPVPPPPAAKSGTNGLAIAGFILAFLVAPLGLILSIVGLVTAGRSGQKGKGLAISGIIIALLLSGGAIAVVAATANKVSTLVDPGCTTGKAAILDNASKISGADADGVKAGLQATVDGLTSAASQAKHDNVRAAMTALRDDYQKLIDAITTGTPADASLQDKINTDAAEIDSLCTVGS